MLRINYIRSVVIAIALGASAAYAGPTNAGGTLYRLNSDATYQHGCFDPCLCPLMLEQRTVGTFVMGPAIIGNVVDFHEITEVNWKVLFENAPQHITGTGTYRITNYGPPLMHALDLDLSIDGAPAQHFFSDFVPVKQNDGSIDITVSINGIFCLDMVIRVSASPVPLNQIKRYGLAGGSTFQRGCFDPCDCLLEEQRPMIGGFALVPVLNYGTYVEYAVAQVRFKALSPANVIPGVNLSGFGTYTLIQGFAGPMQFMNLWISVDGDPLRAFDNSDTQAQPIFPVIDVTVDMNNQVCYDIVLHIKAKPASKSTILSVSAP